MQRVNGNNIKKVVNPYKTRRSAGPQHRVARKGVKYGKLWKISQKETIPWNSFELPPGVRTGLQIENWYLKTFPSVKKMPDKSLYDAERMIDGRAIPCEIKTARAVPSSSGLNFEFRGSEDQHAKLKALKELDLVFLVKREKKTKDKVKHMVSICHARDRKAALKDVHPCYST